MPTRSTQTDGRKTGMKSGRSKPPPIPKKRQTKRLVRQRQGVVETKSRTHEEVSHLTAGGLADQVIVDPTNFVNLNSTKACTFLHPTSFLSFNQGLDEMDLIGLTAFVKAVKMKINLLLPHGANAIKVPFNMYLVHGTVQSLNHTGNTPITAPNTTRLNVRNHIEAKVEDYFNERADKLRFIPKTGVTVDIQGYKKILNDKNTAWLAEAEGSSPYKKSINWQMNKKVKYEKGYPQLSIPHTKPYQEHLYPNYTRLPFCLIYCPQFASILQMNAQGTNINPIQVAYNDCTWFTDS